MIRKVIYTSFIAAILATVVLSGCKGKKAPGGEVKARSFSDPDMLHPINTKDAQSRYAISMIFMSLEGTDPKDYHLTPVIVAARPTISDITDGEYKGGIKLEYEIRPEAIWDNGTPVTGNDYVFTIKSILNPKTNCQPLKPYYEWVGDIVVDKDNPKKYTIFAKEKYFKIEEYAGGYLLPEYVYDPEHLMAKFSIKDFNSDEKRAALKENADIQKFADQYNSEKYQRDTTGVIGCGPYKFAGWQTSQTITLIRKKNWWGDKIKDNRDFIALPEKIIFKIINDPNTALTAVKDGQVDEYHAIQGKQYNELLKNETAKKTLKLDAPSTFAYSFIAFNMKNPKLSDHKVREAIAHCINKEQINDVIGFGLGKLVETFVHPQQKHYNADIKPWGYDLDKARKLLDDAGWKDTDGDGYRDKVINGEKTKLSLDFKIPAGNKGREESGILMKEDLKKVGIEINITAREGSVYQQDMDKRDFEVTYGAYTMDPLMSDPKQIWHTSAAVIGGSNFSGFGNAQTDKLIDDLRKEIDENKRIAMYKQLQQIVHDEIPSVFMFIPANRMAVNKRFSVEETLIDPGYLYNEFKFVPSGM